jgi:hypothetical protein
MPPQVTPTRSRGTEEGTRGEEPSALWCTQVAQGGFVTPRVPVPVCHRRGTSSVPPSHAGYEDRRQRRVWSRVSRRDSL